MVLADDQVRFLIRVFSIYLTELDEILIKSLHALAVVVATCERVHTP